jgi:hypothetical protein
MNVTLFLEIKNEYTEHLVDTLIPYIYEGLTSIYKEAVKLANEINREDNILIIFQKLLQSIITWNQMKISDETNRIKQLSNTSEYLDDLIKAVIKSNIILLTYSNSISNTIGQNFYNSLTTSTFVHRCYTECGKDAHNNPYLFFHDVNPMDYKRNQIIIQQHIQAGIVRAVRKILPISVILKEYLINSINIIQEPHKIELLERPTKKLASDNKIDPNLEKEMMKLIKSENCKSDKQKIQTMMNIDKLITSIKQPANVSSTKRSVNKMSSIKKNVESELPFLLENDEDVDDFENAKLGKSDKKIIDIPLGVESVGNEIKRSVSGTSFTSRPMPNIDKPMTNDKQMSNIDDRPNPETSERIDPNKVNLIEDYGPQKIRSDNSKRMSKKQQYRK